MRFATLSSCWRRVRSMRESGPAVQPRVPRHQSALRTAPQKPIQLIRESLAVRLVERGRATGLHTACTQPVHEVAHLQLLADVVRRVEFTARIESMRAAFD